MSNTALNRTVVAQLTNKSGGNLSYGDVVVIDTTTDSSFTTTTTSGYTATGVGVIVEPNGIASNATGAVATSGWVPKVNLNTASTRGQFLKTHTVAGQATPHSVMTTGDFGYALEASSTPKAIIGAQAFAKAANLVDGDYGDVSISSGVWSLDVGKIDTLTFIIDGGGSTITTGVKGDLEIPFGCTITRATLLADQSGSIVIDIWKDTYANYPPTIADTITASAKPTLSTAIKSQDSTLTGWTTTITAGDTLRFNVDSITTCTRVTLSLKITRTS